MVLLDFVFMILLTPLEGWARGMHKQLSWGAGTTCLIVVAERPLDSSQDPGFQALICHMFLCSEHPL